MKKEIKLTELKRRALIKSFIKKYFRKDCKLWKEYETIDEKGQAHAFQAFPCPIIGAGFFVCELTTKEAIEVFKKQYPDRDFGMAEIEKMDGYTIIFD